MCRDAESAPQLAVFASLIDNKHSAACYQTCCIFEYTFLRRIFALFKCTAVIKQHRRIYKKYICIFIKLRKATDKAALHISDIDKRHL